MAVTSQVRNKLQVASWYYQTFLENIWPLKDENETEGPVTKDEHPADISSAECILGEGSQFRRLRFKILSARSQIWKNSAEQRVTFCYETDLSIP